MNERDIEQLAALQTLLSAMARNAADANAHQVSAHLWQAHSELRKAENQIRQSLGFSTRPPSC